MTRPITSYEIHGSLVERSKLDGAFALRTDGFIKAAGVLLGVSGIAIEVAAGLGARHAVTAAVTSRTVATSIVVSGTDGNVRVNSEGRMVLSWDPAIEHGPFAIADKGL